MILQIHREYVHADYTLSRVTCICGEFWLLEPPLFGLKLKGPHGLLPQQNKCFVKEKGGELCPCLPRCGKPYLQFITPLREFVRADEADFTPALEESPIYFGQLVDDVGMEPDLPLWEEFSRRLTQAVRSRERIRIFYS